MKPARWRTEPNEGGLRSIGQRPRGYELRRGEEVLIHVSALGGGWQRPLEGWYWYGMGRHAYRDSSLLWQTREEAKADADAWFRAQLKTTLSG